MSGDGWFVSGGDVDRARSAAAGGAVFQPAPVAPVCGGARPPGTNAWVRRYAVDPHLQSFCEDRLARRGALRRFGIQRGGARGGEPNPPRLAYVALPILTTPNTTAR